MAICDHLIIDKPVDQSRNMKKSINKAQNKIHLSELVGVADWETLDLF